MPQIKTETIPYLYSKSKIKNSWNNTWYIDRSRFAKKFGNSRFIRGQSANFFSVQRANQFFGTVLSIVQAGIKDGIGKSFMFINDLFIFNGTAITIFMSFIAVWIIENSVKLQYLLVSERLDYSVKHKQCFFKPRNWFGLHWNKYAISSLSGIKWLIGSI